MWTKSRIDANEKADSVSVLFLVSVLESEAASCGTNSAGNSGSASAVKWLNIELEPFVRIMTNLSFILLSEAKLKTRSEASPQNISNFKFCREASLR